MAIFFIAFLSNKYLAEIGGKLRKKGMKCADARIKAINESIGSIKMLKLYSWTDIFAKSIYQKRSAELELLVKRFGVGILIVSSLYFFTNILSVAVFTTYIGMGSTLSLDIAFTVISVLNIIANPMRSLPMFISSMIDLSVSLGRI